MPLSVSHDRKPVVWEQACRYPVILLLAFLVAGVLIGRYLPAARPWPAIFFWVCAGAGIVAMVRQKAAVWFFALGFLFFGWVSMARFASPVINEHHLLAHADGNTRWTITGTVDSDPEIFGNRQVFLLKVDALEAGKKRFEPRGRLRVTLYDAPEKPAFGTGLKFSGVIRPIRNFGNPGAFDYRSYMAWQHVFGLAYAPARRVTMVNEKQAPTFFYAVEILRAELGRAIDRATPGPQAGVLKALVVGKKTDITPWARDAFIRSGVAHLLAISGLHVGIVATGVFVLCCRLFSFVPLLLWTGWVKKSAALVTLCVVAGYGMIAGMSPSTQRAVIMVTVFLLSFVVQRSHRLLNTLALAALTILLVHPPALFAVSFQLSFSAVFFIVFGMGVMQARVARISRRPVKIAANFLLVSFLAIVGTLPLTLHYFNQTSLVGLASNCILVPMVGFVAVPLGLVGVIGHMAWPPAGSLLFGMAGTVVQGALAVAQAIAGLPFAAAHTITPNLLEMACLYMLLASGLAFAGNRSGHAPPDTEPVEGKRFVKTWPALLFFFALAVLACDTGYWICHRLLHKDLRITVLDVGQGNAAVVELPRGKVMLIDGGGFAGSSTFDVGERIVAPFLWRNKIATVDILVATHPDTDHIGGLAYVADKFHVKQLWSSGQPADTEDYQALMDAVARREILMPAYETLYGSRTLNGVDVDLLYPAAGFSDPGRAGSWQGTNNNSLVTKISLKEVSFLFPGDILKKAESELVATTGDRLASTVLIVPHHGSKTSSTPVFLDRVRPEVAVFSAGWGNRYNYPHPEVLERYKTLNTRIYRTDLDGAVIMKTDGTVLTVETPCAP
ncbi:DNA internalization-related competence protein ComEC/Rec2 [Desulfosudis oleivorans]|uniref:DNA internalization-related competence protein ComEC/Rec2 n=1 Tax=Desulfosudis oleivorans (strain DSM 6200 / JCM 39069 / Hxd3) TaxID=96561 RepID=A8ZVB6_DESOH|nr:DNA internalization-related competence protein ComEC/Rec2 [Desulfosudis oleivorans]ABW66577.1 DNA internalization-related competence protein ComEC/Rec2 [Desulfosudis oleivorans Hxd3]